MIFPPPLSLSLVGVADAGVPNHERLVLRPSDTVNLAGYGVMVALGVANSGVWPLNDNFFWFGELTITPPSWVLLYTRSGEYHTMTHTDGNPVHVFFWNRATTIFGPADIVPVVFEISTITIGGRYPSPAPTKQIGSGLSLADLMKLKKT